MKHVHAIEYNKWVLYLEQRKQGLEAIENQQQCRKRKVAPPSQITSFFGTTIPYHKSDPTQHVFLEGLCLYITKGYHPLSLVENPWLKWLGASKPQGGFPISSPPNKRNPSLYGVKNNGFKSCFFKL